MTKKATAASPEAVEQEAVNNVTVNATQETADIQVEEEKEAAEVIEEISKESAAEEVIDTDLDRISEQDAVIEEPTEDQPESNETSEGNQAIEETEDAQVQDSEEVQEFDPEVKYDFSAKVLDDYLAKYKEEDKIIQESRGGNFVSNRDHTVYVPLSLFIK